VYRVLRQHEFEDATPAAGKRWAVSGRLGDLRVVVACVTDIHGVYALEVGSELGRLRLCELLRSAGATGVPVRAQAAGEHWVEPWVALAVGLGAVALLGWVITSIHVGG
jgi:hypothetical protein